MSPNLLDYDAAQLAGFVAEIGEKPFRARQLLRWMHQCGEADFAKMSDLAKPPREKLSARGWVGATRVTAAGPVAGFVQQREDVRGPVDVRGRLVGVQRGRQRAVLHRHHHLDHAGDARRGLCVAKIGLHRAEP